MLKPQKAKASGLIQITTHGDRPISERIAIVNQSLLDRLGKDDRVKLSQITGDDQIIYEYARMGDEV